MAKPAFAKGAQIEHARFGLGAVMECTEEVVQIKFDEHGEKKFVLSIVLPNLKKSDRVAPEVKKRATRKKAEPGAVKPAKAVKAAKAVKTAK